MDELKELKKYLNDGYLLDGPVLRLSEKTPKSIAEAYSFFEINIDLNVLLDPANKDKTMLLLRHPNIKKRIAILTSNNQVISKAISQYKYQRERIGTIMNFQVVALGGRSDKERIFHLDQFISSLDGLFGWKFSLGSNIGEFKIEIKSNSVDDTDTIEILSRLQLILDYFAFYFGVGFHIRHKFITNIPRIGPYVSGIGGEERMLSPVTTTELEKINSLKGKHLLLEAMRGLREAYIETTMPGRISRLWSTIETIFGEKQQKLLSDSEIEEILSNAALISSLEKDSKRLGKFKDTLQKATLTSRNEHIATNIALTMDKGFKETYQDVKMASMLRGKHLHRILMEDVDNMQSSEKFLQAALITYIEKQLEFKKK